VSEVLNDARNIKDYFALIFRFRLLFVLILSNHHRAQIDLESKMIINM